MNMEGDMATLLTKSENIDCIKINDEQITTDNNIYALYDDSKILEQEQFCFNLASHYSAVLPSLCPDSLGQALMNSLFDSTNSRPLALYIHDDQSPATHMFNETVLWLESINAYLAEQFLLWSWNLTKENYYELLTTVSVHAGEEVAAVIDSTPTDFYPLLICLIFDRGQIKVEGVIHGMMSDNEVFTLLIQAHDAFGTRFDLPDTTGLSLTNISKENWSIQASTLTQVANESAEFRRVAADFDSGASSIVRIDRIENTLWLMQYLNQKQIIDTREGHDANEKLLFHGCPYTSAELILQQGFDHDRIGRNGSYYGKGFYFSTRRLVSDRFALPDPKTGRKKILMCRVLIGRSCQGDLSTTTCPSGFDSTTNGSNIHVVYSNRHVLPEYLITYK